MPPTNRQPSVSESNVQRRAIDRSTESARLRAAKRVQRFLDAAREIIIEKHSTEFTVQEVVERSQQSLRSFYQYFDGKHELLLGLFETEILRATDEIRSASAGGAPLDRLRSAVIALYNTSNPKNDSVQPLFFEFAQRLLLDHPDEVAAAYSPLFEYVATLVQDAADAGLLRPGRPRRLATMVMQAATATAGRSGGPVAQGRQPITAEELWEFCLHAIVSDATLAELAPPAPSGRRRRS